VKHGMLRRIIILLAVLCFLPEMKIAADDGTDISAVSDENDQGTSVDSGSSSSDSSDDSINALFSEPTKTAEEASSSVLTELKEKQPLLSYSFDLYAAGGLFIGYTSPDSFANGLEYISQGDWNSAVAASGHGAIGGLELSCHIDLRPVDYIRVHGSGYVLYPTTSGTSYIFGWALSELFVDYSMPQGLSLRTGKYTVAWGNGRMLGVADLPGRTVSTSSLSSSVTLLPSWLNATKPSVWAKVSMPLGALSFTGLAGLPSMTTSGISDTGLGLQIEWTHKKTCIAASGYYKNGYTPRVAITSKTSLAGIDFFLDTAVAFSTSSGTLLSADGGGYYRTSSDPDIAITAELQYNGERVPGSGDLVADAIDVGGLSQAMAFSWGKICGSPITAGMTEYNNWTDGSGAVIPTIMIDVLPSVTLRFTLPFIYGDSGSEYLTYRPDEADGYCAGLGILLLLKASF